MICLRAERSSGAPLAKTPHVGLMTTWLVVQIKRMLRTFVAKLQPCPTPLERDMTAIQGFKLLSGRRISEHASAGSAACILQ